MQDTYVNMNEISKDSTVSLRLSSKEKKYIDNIAKSLDLNMTDYIRYALVITDPHTLKAKFLEYEKNKYMDILKRVQCIPGESKLKKIRIIKQNFELFYSSVQCIDIIDKEKNIYQLEYSFFINGCKSFVLKKRYFQS